MLTAFLNPDALYHQQENISTCDHSSGSCF